MNKRTLKSEELQILTASLSVLLHAGISLQEGFSILFEEANKEYKELYTSLNDMMKEGMPLSTAFERTQMFPQYMISMSRVGEATGRLDEVMSALSKYYERESNMKEQLRTAITYPMVLLCMMCVVVAILVFKILPIFQNVLRSLGSNLTSFSLMFMQIGQVLAQIGFVVLLVIIIMVFIVWMRNRKRSDDGFVNIIAHLRLARTLYYNLSVAQVTYILTLFQNSGADSIEAFQYMKEMKLHTQVTTKIETAVNAMKEGSNVAKAIRDVALYQGMEASMLEVGFRSGQQDQVLKQLADTYEQKVELAIVHFLNILEPTIVAILSILVGMVLLSVMLPLMGIMSSAG